MASLTIQAVSAILCGKTLLLSPLTSFHRFQSGKFISKEDTKGNKNASVGSSMAVERVRNAQRNALENILISVLMFAINSKAAYAHGIFKIILAARILHTVCYLQGLQPWRGLAFAVGMACNIIMCYTTFTSGNDFNKILSLLLLKVQIMSPITGVMRKIFKAPHGAIAEDLKASGLEKPPEKRNVRVQRVAAAHLNDLYVIIPFVIMALISKQAGIMKMADMTVFMQYFFYCRLVHTVVAVVGLPYIFQAAALFGSIAVSGMMVMPWKFHKKFDIHRKSHLLMALMAKVILFAFLEQLFYIFKGQFGPSTEELEEPEKFQEAETTRLANLLRNDAENVLTTAVLVMIIRFVNIPLNLLYIFTIARLAHSVVYFLHVPQPSRALSWMVAVVFSVRIALVAFK